MDKVDIKSNYKQNNTIALPEPDKNGFIFEIDDEMYLYYQIYIVVLGILLLLDVFLTNSNIFDGIRKILGCYMLLYGFINIYKYIKNKRKIVFFTNKITRTYQNRYIKLNNVYEAYIVNYLISFLSYNQKINRKKINNYVELFFFIFLYLLFLPLVLIAVMINFIYSKRLSTPKILVIIGQNDKENIKIQIYIPNNKDTRVVEYFKKYLNTDIEKLETLWFIPKKENTNE